MRFASLVNALDSLLQNRPGREVRVLPEDQLIVRYALKPNPAVGAHLKAAREVPSERGYEVYVACRRAPASALAQPAALRAPLPFSPDERLQLTRDVDAASWQFVNPDGDTVKIRVHLGSRASREEVNAILARVETALLR